MRNEFWINTVPLIWIFCVSYWNVSINSHITESRSLSGYIWPSVKVIIYFDWLWRALACSMRTDRGASLFSVGPFGTLIVPNSRLRDRTPYELRLTRKLQSAFTINDWAELTEQVGTESLGAPLCSRPSDNFLNLSQQRMEDTFPTKSGCQVILIMNRYRYTIPMKFWPRLNSCFPLG